MADRPDSDREVLTSLPRSRPVRRSAKRGDRAVAKAGASAPQRRAAAMTTAGPAKAASGRTAKPASGRATKTASARAPKAASARAPKAAPRSGPAPRRKVPPAGYAAPSARAEDTAGSGTADLLGTTIQAVAELAQIGLTVGRQTVQSMLDRLPKP